MDPDLEKAFQEVEDAEVSGPPGERGLFTSNKPGAHKAKLSHQLVAGAAAFMAMKAYNVSSSPPPPGGHQERLCSRDVGVECRVFLVG